MTSPRSLQISKTVVVGPGIVGMPMAALLADATRRLDKPQGEVVVIQRNSPTSGWKVGAINRGESPIGGVEPGLDHLVKENAKAGTLRAAHTYEEAGDADAILVCVQTDKDGIGPDYGPLFEALHGIGKALAASPVRKAPLLVIESTLAPSSMQSIVLPLFESYGLKDGETIFLGNSPNRVMPGRLVERVAAADKIVGGLLPETREKIVALYSRIVTAGTLLPTSSLTAEVVKTLENAYRDVRIAFAAELVRWCDEHDVDFFDLRERMNERLARVDDASRDGTAVPTGALLVPTVGVGGHCLPKDGILMWWRAVEGGVPTSHALILAARKINDDSPSRTLQMARKLGATISGQKVAVLGAAYRPDSEDTRNAPSLQLALQLQTAGADVVVHDPYVRDRDANLAKLNLTNAFTNDIEKALRDAEVVFVATGHAVYRDLPDRLNTLAPRLRVLVDSSNLYKRDAFRGSVTFGGIGRGKWSPSAPLLESALAQFRAVERGVANEVAEVCDFLNANYADGAYNEILFEDVQRLARTCATGCDIVDSGWVNLPALDAGFMSRLAQLSYTRWGIRRVGRTVNKPWHRPKATQLAATE